MNKITASRAAFAILALAGLLAAPIRADAQTKVWVAATGGNGNPCTLAQPCATLQHAHDVVAAGGEIGVFNPGDYGSVTIAKTVDITNDGSGVAGIVVGAGGFGITVGAGSGDVVGLRGLTIDGQGIASQGVHITQASAVHIQNCVVRNFEQAGSGYGIVLQPSGMIRTQLFVSDTIVYNNGSTAGTGGIYIGPNGTASANVVLHRVHLENNVIGLWVDGFNSTGDGSHVILRDSVASGNASDGIQARSLPGGSPAFVVVEKSSSVDNAGNGILANGPRATILIDDNTISRNGAGISAVNGGQILSYGNNQNNNNVGPEGTPTGTLSQM